MAMGNGRFCRRGRRRDSTAKTFVNGEEEGLWLGYVQLSACKKEDVTGLEHVRDKDPMPMDSLE